MVMKFLSSIKEFLGQKPRNFRWLLLILMLIAISVGSYFLIYQNNTFSLQGVSKDNTIIELKDNTIIELKDNTIIELPKDIFFECNFNNKLIGVKSDGQTICSYDVQSQKLKELYTSTKEYYVKKIVANAEWIIWVENDAYADSAGTGASKCK